jgi:hypothetical protein
VWITSVDPGVPSTFVLLRIGSESIEAMCGKVAAPEVDSALDFHGAAAHWAQPFGTLGEMLGASSLIAWERQRGWIREHVEEPLLSWCAAQNAQVCVISPSEKYHRLCVTSDKSQAVACAVHHFEHVPGTLAPLLASWPVEEIHDYADAALLLVMALELQSVPSLRALYHTDEQLPWRGHLADGPTVPARSRCALARKLSAIYRGTDQTGRRGANIPRRYRVQRRIRSCTIDALDLGSCFRPRVRDTIRLTRAGLGGIGVPKSEASDLCIVLEKFRTAATACFGMVDGFKVTGSCGTEFVLWSPLGPTERLARFAVSKEDVPSFNSIMLMNA